MSDARKQYWDGQYVDYWQARVEEANRSGSSSSLVNGDTRAPSDRLYSELINLLHITPKQRILELGCGFGRTIPLLYELTHQISAVDISPRMIELARQSHGMLKGVSFQVSEAENLPFDGHHFDCVICFGVFDALTQTEALIEMNRVLKVGGCVLITGKNDRYYSDDNQALIAERNARAKGHPNFFTDVASLLRLQQAFGFSTVECRFFPRRGDMAANNFTTELPEFFYEYALVLRKKAEPQHQAKALRLSVPISNTCQALGQGEC